MVARFANFASLEYTTRPRYVRVYIYVFAKNRAGMCNANLRYRVTDGRRRRRDVPLPSAVFFVVRGKYRRKRDVGDYYPRFLLSEASESGGGRFCARRSRCLPLPSSYLKDGECAVYVNLNEPVAVQADIESTSSQLAILPPTPSPSARAFYQRNTRGQLSM